MQRLVLSRVFPACSKAVRGVASLSVESPLLQQTGFIQGEFLPLSPELEMFEVKNPANGQVIERVMNMNQDHALKAIESASQAWLSWRQTTGVERSRYLQRIISLTYKYKEDLAKIITLESGFTC